MFWRGVMGYLPVQIVQALAGFGAVIAFTRLLTPEAYGHYALAYSVAALSQTIFLTWNEAATARFTAAETAGGGLATHLRTLHRAMWIMVAVVLTLGAPLLLVLPLDPNLKLAVGAGVLAFALKSALRLVMERMRATGDVRGFATIDIVITGGGFLAGMALALAGWGGAAPMAGYGVLVAACLAWFWPREMRRARGGGIDPERLRRNIGYGLPVALALVASLALATADRFLIATFLDEASVGAYHAGYSVGNRLLDVLFVWLSLAGGPALVAALERGGPEALTRAAREQGELLIWLTLPAATGLALVSEPLIGILVGEELRTQAASVTPLIAMAAFFAGLHTHYFGQAFTLGRRTGLLVGVMTAPALLSIGLNVLLVPRFGLIGAAWATTIGYALGALLSATLGRTVLILPVPWTALARAGLASGVMAACVAALPSPGGWLELLGKAAVGAATYAAVMLLLDAHLRERLGRLRSGLRARTA
ncbi:MAG: lipopolysaccharide biosynthesis protein [Proteobacteria bacterium]|nr:lipopolysaccharide biosynthesis protein [Pseudomonadota bacterium]